MNCCMLHVAYEMPEPPDQATCELFKLLKNDGTAMKPVFVGPSEVWMSAFREDEPIYAVFNGGTNRVVVLEKSAGSWREVSLQQVKNLYGLIWRMCLEKESGT
jgi:hypothetical protein